MEFKENEVKEVGPGVWIREAVDNISWANLGNGAAVIDALEDSNQADVVRDLIEETTGQNLKWIVQTHWDVDHIACNPQWKREGAVAIAHQSCADSAGEWEGRPNISYSNEAVLQGDFGKRIEMKWVGGTHTPWDCLLHFPHARVLHIADLFGWGLIPCKPTREKVARLREVYAMILEYDVDAVICGHGPTLQLEQLRQMNEYLNLMIEMAPPLISAGHRDEEIAEKITPPEAMREWWRFLEWKHGMNVKLIRENWQA